MLPPEEQQTKITELTNILVGQRTGGTNTTTPPPADPMAALKAQAAAILAKRPK